jgi:hypothetical protein
MILSQPPSHDTVPLIKVVHNANIVQFLC